MMKVGDIVEYLDDWKKGRQWYLHDLYGDSLCRIVLMRNDSYTKAKGTEIMLNANIVNLNVSKIREYGKGNT